MKKKIIALIVSTAMMSSSLLPVCGAGFTDGTGAKINVAASVHEKDYISYSYNYIAISNTFMVSAATAVSKDKAPNYDIWLADSFLNGLDNKGGGI